MTTPMQDYVLEPKAPLVFRSGKPFEPGIRDGAHYPWPSSWAGLLRTRYMDDQGWDGADDPQRLQTLLGLAAHGVLLAQRSGERLDLYLPKPADALLLTKETAFRRLLPCPLPAGTGSDLPPDLLPVSTAEEALGKPAPSAPFWSLKDYLDWAAGKEVAPRSAEGFPLEAARTHVAIERASQAADDGRLFRSEGLDFGAQRQARGGAANAAAFSSHDWVLLGKGPPGLSPGLIAFGGERRLSYLHAATGKPLAIPSSLASALVGATGFALTFATPALFAHGWKPAWLDDTLQGEPPGCPGLRVRLRAALVERWDGLSGWDLHQRKPKPSRRAVAAGATYWFDVVAGTLDPHALWLQPLSDAPQDRLDGFGLALIRPWSPTL